MSKSVSIEVFTMARKTTLQEVIDPINMERAWRWIKSNPDSRYKGYFRESYSDYSLIEVSVLKDLSKRVSSKTYSPEHGCKIFIPKASGVLRPYTLLTVEDQIVYQAMVNVIAEHLLPYVKNSYYKSTFGNLYAGKSNIWFYRKWSKGYKGFNDGAREAFNSGLKFSASFDLTACYDSLDHNVLRHFLKTIKCDNEFIDLLTVCLSKWTGNGKTKIYHNHGIPQGPLSSGLLSEVVLRYFDIKYGSNPQVRYMRYVDDIRLFAKSEKELRQMLIKFDRLSKDIGLFPQSSKIEIHEVKNIEDEIKTVSSPAESSIQRTLVNQKLLQKRIIELTERYVIKDPTRFKYVLAHAIPSSKINDRVWRIYKQHISNFESIFRYFQRYEKLPQKVSKIFIEEIKSQPVYSAITAGLVATLRGRVNVAEENNFKRLVKLLWKPISLTSELVLHSILIRTVIENNLLTTAQLKYALNAPEWYVRLQGVKALENNGLIGITIITNLLNEKLKDKSNDVACASAVIIVKNNLTVNKPIPASINIRAATILREAGKIGRMPTGSTWCAVNIHLNHWLDNSITGIDWKSIFGSRYVHAQGLAYNCRANAGIDTTSWVNAQDVFNDLLLDCLYKHDPSIGGYTVGNVGSVLFSTRFSAKYPAIFAMVKSIHEKRLESNLSHAYVRSTGKITGPIKFGYYKREGKYLVKNALKELGAKW